VNDARGPRLRFYLKQMPKSATGFRGVQTAAYSTASVSTVSCSFSNKQPAASGRVIRFNRFTP